MPHPPRLIPRDVELGKRDDDHKPGSKRPLVAPWFHHRIFLRRSYKRIVWGLVLLFGLYYFFRYLQTNLSSSSYGPDYDQTSAAQKENHWSKTHTGRPKEPNEGASSGAIAPEDDEPESKHWFNGPIKFYNLASTLSPIAHNPNAGYARNVIFAASNVKSAGTLLSLACEMATFKRNNVHFTFMGRDDISLDVLKEVNGVGPGCEVMFHDSRPDFLLQSSDFRMEVSSSAALGHIDNYMHPQAIIVDNSGTEELWFLKAMRDRSSWLGKALIELPGDVDQSLRWITRLDSSSLMFWNKISIDIVIHAQHAASGSLLRLLGSLSKADYCNSAPPRLTIELPNVVDGPTSSYLQEFRWPPSHRPLEGSANQLNLHHRIPEPGLSAEQNSIRFLESFWPMNPATSHLLILSPQVELSPLFFQYLKYSLLEYKYSANYTIENKLMGISLDLPSTYLNDTSAFSPPKKISKTSSDSSSATFFLWQAPNSNAFLYFGDIWAELHSFVSHSITAQHKPGTPNTPNSKEVGKTYPSWLEEILKLARIRGYYFLYSALDDEAALATVHNELFKPPEEFSQSGQTDAHSAPQVSKDFTADPAYHLSLQHAEKPLASKSLMTLLPSEGQLPPLTEMPLLSWDGTSTTRIELERTAANYSESFRHEMGGCSTSDKYIPVAEGSADDLFCPKDADEV